MITLAHELLSKKPRAIELLFYLFIYNRESINIMVNCGILKYISRFYFYILYSESLKLIYSYLSICVLFCHLLCCLNLIAIQFCSVIVYMIKVVTYTKAKHRSVMLCIRESYFWGKDHKF